MEDRLTAPVRYKKRDGLVDISQRGIQWKPKTSGDGKPIGVPWNHVQDQQVSSSSSPKAMIRLRLTSNITLVLEFTHPTGLEKAFESRDKAKALIARYLGATPSSKAKTRSAPWTKTEIQQRAALLASNPSLKRQHTEMVGEGLISEEDFWMSRKDLLANEASKRQKTGKTSAILTDLEGNAEGGNVVKYNLNAEVIHQIFVQYPAVHLAYKEQVPDQMTETEFWSAFFKSKYFHRDRKNLTASTAGQEDLFTRYEEKEKEVQDKEKPDPRGVVDPLVDLTSTNEDTVAKHGGTKQVELTTTQRKEQEAKKRTVDKFNRHAAYVLDPSRSQETANKKATPYHDTLQDAISLDDLQDSASDHFTPLTLEDESRYFDHLKDGASSQNTAMRGNDPSASMNNFQKVVEEPIELGKAFPPMKSALDVMSEIVSRFDGDQDAAANSQSTLSAGALAAGSIPADFKQQVYDQFHDVCELLRHYLSFRRKAKMEGDGGDAHVKLKRIKDKMEKKYAELVNIRRALPPHEKNSLGKLLQPFENQLNLAFIEEK